MISKNLICLFFGHKPKKYEPLYYWFEGVGKVKSWCEPIFCSRCGCSQYEIIIDLIYKGKIK